MINQLKIPTRLRLKKYGEVDYVGEDADHKLQMKTVATNEIISISRKDLSNLLIWADEKVGS